MSDELEKSELIEPPKMADKLARSENISTSEQNHDYAQALASNPDQFPSIANLRIPNADQIEPFQLVDGTKSIAASRKIEQSQPAIAVQDSFNQGLLALPEGTTLEQLAQFQIDYINRKADSIEAASTMPAISSQLKLEGQVEKTQLYQQSDEYFERMAGFLIGSTQGLGSVAINLAYIADFAAYCILGDDRALKMGAEFGNSLANTIFAGGKLFQSAYDYLYDVGFEGDYSKPFSDIASLAIILNNRWQQLPPREQERRKGELITQLIADSFVGIAGAQSLGKAKTFTELLDGIATKSIDRAGQTSEKLIESIARHVDDLLLPELEVAGVGKIKMKDLPRITKDDLYNAMSDWGRLGGSTEESVAIKLEKYLLNPIHSAGGPKSEFFRRALGFTRKNADELAKQIVFDEDKAVLKAVTEHGTKYDQEILIKGANGREIVVPFTFMKYTDGVVRLVTASNFGKK